MIRYVQADGYEILIPETWDDLTVDQFFAMVDEVEKDGGRCINIFSILLRIDYREIAHIDAPEFTQLLCESMVYFRDTSAEQWYQRMRRVQ